MRTPEEIRVWLRGVLAVTGLSVAELAKRSGVGKATIFRALSESYEFTPSSRTLQKIAEAANYADVFDPDIDRAVMPVTEIVLSTTFRVGADVWQGNMEPDKTGILSALSPISAHPLFDPDTQTAAYMQGGSMDEYYYDGDFLHFIELAALPYRPGPGAHLLIRRADRQNDRYEFTLREFTRVSQGMAEFTFRSKSRPLGKPLLLPASTVFEDATVKEGGIETSVDGLLFGFYRRSTNARGLDRSHK